MLVIQISDLHVAANRGLAFNVADGAALLEKTVDHLIALPQKPDCVVVSGDIAVNGYPGGYAIVAEQLARFRVPVFALPGNHDNRENLLAALGPYCPADRAMAPYLCYTREEFPVRLVFADGTRPGSHSGHLDEQVAAWLKAVFREKTDTPTLLFTHHPPFLSALGGMDEPYENAATFGRILEENPQVRLCCGHLHRPMFTLWHGAMAMTAPPLALHIVPDLSPQGGDAFTDGTPAYLAHHWYKGCLNTHVCPVPGTFEYKGPYSFARPPAHP